MNEYVVKNCPACCEYTQIYCCEDNYDSQGRDTYCELIDNCLIKQVVERCKQSLNYSSKEPYELGRTNMAGIILAYFEIEECE